jgi:ubiquinone/menaquinone biosynthesis C-methylase UbiE
MSNDLHTMNERPALYAFARDWARALGPARVLDVACGSGEGTEILARGLPGAVVTGIDLNDSLVRFAKEAFRAENLRYETGDALALQVPDASFDIVVTCHTIEHFSARDQERFLREMRRVLKPDGWLFAATPDRDVWALQGIAGQQEDHIQELTQREFGELIRSSGFRMNGLFGQYLLREGSFPFRRLLNTLKRLDVFRLRRLMRGTVKAMDRSTRPVDLDTAVVPIPSGGKASTTVIIAQKT